MSIEQAVTRAAVGATLKVVLNSIKSDPERSIRYALDLLDCFPKRSLGDKLTAKLRRELENPRSSVCKLIAAMSAGVDHSILGTVGTNLCCNRMARPRKDVSPRKKPRGPVRTESLGQAVGMGKRLGVYFYVIRGWEPLRYREEIFKLCVGNRDCVFFLITDSRLIDSDFADRCARAGNIILSVKIDSKETLSDIGVALSILKKHKCLYGFTAGINSETMEKYCRKDFADYMASVGCVFGWYFSDEQGQNRTGCIRAIRNAVRAAFARSSGPILLLDAQIDRHIRNLFIAGGRCYVFCNSKEKTEFSAKYVLAGKSL